MNDKEAYEHLKTERPVITHVLHRDINRCRSADILAERTMSSDDPPELRELIRQAARYVWEIRP